MTTPLIALTGPAGSGKTTFARSLVKNFGYVRISFAEPIRAMLRALGLTDADMSEGKMSPLAILGGKTPRYAMQTLGTEWGRQLITDNLWVNATEKRIRAAWVAGQNVVIDDCRFDNEATMILNLGGKVIRLQRPGTIKMEHTSEAGVSEHLITGAFNNAGESLGLVDCAAASLIIM